jgi:hypothetical protein
VTILSNSHNVAFCINKKVDTLSQKGAFLKLRTKIVINEGKERHYLQLS